MLEISQSRLSPKPETVRRAQAALEQVLRRPETTFPSLVDREPLWTEAASVGASMGRRFHRVVLCGIGGSSLGPRMISALSADPKMLFFDNVDGASFDRLTSRLDLATTGFLFISKSGGTIETLAAADAVSELLKAKGIALPAHAHVLTESPNNALARWARDKDVPLTLIPSDVGGRFSVLSPVGMIPAVVEGLRLEDFREGARSALQRREFVADLMARFFESFERGEWITVFWFYDDLGKLMGAWIQQLWAESLGKKVDRQGKAAPRASTPLPAIGATDQHSFLQQIMEGARDKLVVFIRSGSAEGGQVRLTQPGFAETQSLKGHALGRLLRAEALATEEALAREGVSTLTLKTEVLDERGCGEMFFVMQMVVAGLGEMLGIDPFDQPGVELGKRLAKEFLQRP